MNEQHPTTHPTVSELARMVDCLDESGFANLAGVKLSTVNAWRKRGIGPDYILLGCNYLYPLEAVRKYIMGLVRVRTPVNAALCVL